ncbi:MAG: hypothetical protein K0R81_3425 [Microbacterium sp.]|nr:hypothetical protein [Microbacterium sp.]
MTLRLKSLRNRMPSSLRSVRTSSMMSQVRVSRSENSYSAASLALTMRTNASTTNE